MPSEPCAAPLGSHEVNEPTTPASSHLPGYLVLLIGFAVILLWLGLLLLVIGFVMANRTVGFSIDDVLPNHLEGTMRTAMIVQYSSILLNLAILFVFGNLVCCAWIFGNHPLAVSCAIWLIRILILLTITQLFVSMALPFAAGGLAGALPGLATQLPFMLVSGGFLIFAERTLVYRYSRP